MRRKRRRPAQKFNRKMRTKLMVLFSLILAVLCGLVGRLTYIEHTKGETYQKKVLSMQSYDSKTIPYQRGEIIDRSGTVLATSVAVYNVILDCTVVNDKEEYVDPTVEALVKCFPELDETEIRRIIKEKKDKRYIVLAKKVPYDEVQPFVELQDAVDKKGNKVNPDIKGVWFEKEYQRNYPFGSLASSVIGFTSSGNVGTTGLENYYNSTLNGINGREYGYLDSDSDFEKTVIDAQDGDALVTSIDANIQSIVEEKIKDWNEKYRDNYYKGTGSINTAAIVMNPNNGEILAMADYPNVDLNNPRDLTKYYTEEQLKKMTDQEKLDTLNDLWNNYCVSNTYEPGSTFKPFTISAGLETGVLTGNENYVCGGVMHVGDHDIHCSNRSGHGPETLKQALENSCNVALMQIGASIGTEEFCRYQRLFGFGEYTGIDLPGEGETSGLLYTPATMDPASLATNAFGQNFNVTMTQMAASFSSLINGGNYYEPHVVKQIQDDNGNVTENKDPVLVKKTISKETSDIIKDYMLGVVEEGTGASAAVEGYAVGGKTGTAEKLPRGNGKYLVSFIGYAPQENPQVMVYVVIDEPNSAVQANSGYATQLASQIMTDIFPYLGIEKKTDSASNTDTQTTQTAQQ